MPKRKSTRPPFQRAQRPAQLGILELERFSQETLTRWNALSEDLDELQAALYFGILPEQRRLRESLLDAVRQSTPMTVPLSRWARIVTYQYSTEPLSAAGSLHGWGGRHPCSWIRRHSLPIHQREGSLYRRVPRPSAIWIVYRVGRRSAKFRGTHAARHRDW